MKTKTNPLDAFPEEIVDRCSLDVENGIITALSPGLLIVRNTKSTAMELINCISMLAELSADLTVKLAKACGFCDNCGDIVHGCPGEWAQDCELCKELLDTNNRIFVPDYLRDEAGIPLNAKLEATGDEDDGSITLYKADYDYDISDVPDELLELLFASGVCLAELDEALRTERAIDVR